MKDLGVIIGVKVGLRGCRCLIMYGYSSKEFLSKSVGFYSILFLISILIGNPCSSRGKLIFFVALNVYTIITILLIYYDIKKHEK